MYFRIGRRGKKSRKNYNFMTSILSRTCEGLNKRNDAEEEEKKKNKNEYDRKRCVFERSEIGQYTNSIGKRVKISAMFYKIQFLYKFERTMVVYVCRRKKK